MWNQHQLHGLSHNWRVISLNIRGHGELSILDNGYYDLFDGYYPGRMVFTDQPPPVSAKLDWLVEHIVTHDCLLSDLPVLTKFYLDALGAETDEAWAPLVARLFSPKNPPDEQLHFASEIVELPRRHAADSFYNHCSLDWCDVIKMIRLPTLVVGAEESIFASKSKVWTADQIPDAEVEIFPADERVAHLMCYENPTKFNAPVSAFLS